MELLNVARCSKEHIGQKRHRNANILLTKDFILFIKLIWSLTSFLIRWKHSHSPIKTWVWIHNYCLLMLKYVKRSSACNLQYLSWSVPCYRYLHILMNLKKISIHFCAIPFVPKGSNQNENRFLRKWEYLDVFRIS